MSHKQADCPLIRAHLWSYLSTFLPVRLDVLLFHKFFLNIVVQHIRPSLIFKIKQTKYIQVFALERRTDRLAAAGKLATVTSEDELIGFANEIELLAMYVKS